MMKFDQDLCLKKLLWFTKAYKQSSTLGSVVPLAMFLLFGTIGVAETHNVAANVACYEQDNTYRLRAENMAFLCIKTMALFF